VRTKRSTAREGSKAVDEDKGQQNISAEGEKAEELASEDTRVVRNVDSSGNQIQNEPNDHDGSEETTNPSSSGSLEEPEENEEGARDTDDLVRDGRERYSDSSDG